MCQIVIKFGSRVNYSRKWLIKSVPENTVSTYASSLSLGSTSSTKSTVSSTATCSKLEAPGWAVRLFLEPIYQMFQFLNNFFCPERLSEYFLKKFPYIRHNIKLSIRPAYFCMLCWFSSDRTILGFQPFFLFSLAEQFFIFSAGWIFLMSSAIWTLQMVLSRGQESSTRGPRLSRFWNIF
jgi:hypothetical protein